MICQCGNDSVCQYGACAFCCDCNQKIGHRRKNPLDEEIRTLERMAVATGAETDILQLERARNRAGHPSYLSSLRNLVAGSDDDQALAKVKGLIQYYLQGDNQDWTLTGTRWTNTETGEQRREKPVAPLSSLPHIRFGELNQDCRIPYILMNFMNHNRPRGPAPRKGSPFTSPPGERHLKSPW